MKISRLSYGWRLLLLCFMLIGCGSHSEELAISAIDHFNRGNSYYKQNKLQSAADEYKMAIAQDPKQERFHYNLGLVYYSLVIYGKAIEQYNQAIEINPRFGEAWYNLALAYERIDDTEKAYMAYQKYQMLNRESQDHASEKPKPIIINKPEDTKKAK